MAKDIAKSAFAGGPIDTYGELVASDTDPKGRGNPDLKAVYEELDSLKHKIDEIVTLLRNNGIS